MDFGPGKMHSTHGTNHTSLPKRVHWAPNLEEIAYYSPYNLPHEVTELKTAKYTDSMQKVETKVDASKTKRPHQSLVAARKMQEKVWEFVEKVYGPSDEVDFELLKELHKHWDDLALE